MKKTFTRISIVLAIALSGAFSMANANEASSKFDADAVRYVTYTRNNTDKGTFDFTGNESNLRDWHCEWVDADGIGHDCTYIDVIVTEE